MNKQFLSLLLLTSFVGTMSPTITSAKSHPYIATGVVAASCGLAYLVCNKPKNIKASASNGVAAVKRNPIKSAAAAVGVGAAVGVVAKYYPQSAINGFDFISGYASSAKTLVANGIKSIADYTVIPVSNGIKAAVASYPRSATAVVAACGLIYLGSKFWNRDSMSLTEQGKTSLRNALVKANELGTEGFHNPSVATPLKSCEFFTIKDNELPKIVIDALNNHIMILRKLVEINQVKQTSKLSDSDLAIETNWKTRSKQVLAELTAASAE